MQALTRGVTTTALGNYGEPRVHVLNECAKYLLQDACSCRIKMNMQSFWDIFLNSAS